MAYPSSIKDLKVLPTCLLALLLLRAAAQPLSTRKACESQDVDECIDDEQLAPVQLLQHDLQLTQNMALEIQAAQKKLDESAAKQRQEESVTASQKQEESVAAKQKQEESAAAKQKQEESAAKQKQKQEESVSAKQKQEESISAKQKQEERAAKQKQEESRGKQKQEDAAAQKEQEESSAQNQNQESASQKKQQESAAQQELEDTAVQQTYEESATQQRQPVSLMQKVAAQQILEGAAAAAEFTGAGDTQAAQVTTTTTPPPTGLSMNAVGDMKTFFTSLIMYYVASIVCIVGFSFMRTRYPAVYEHNQMEGKTPTKTTNSLFGWYRPTMILTIDQFQEYVGLDHAMLIEYSHMCMKMMIGIGLPMFFIQGPLNWAFGGLAAGGDHLSYLSFGNVEDLSWLYWLHCFEVWAVVIFSTWVLHDGMRKFLPRRQKWLAEMSQSRSHTVLVEGIPQEYRSEEKLRAVFERLLPGATVSGVETLKDTSELEPLVSAHENALYRLHAAEAEAAAHPDAPPMIRESYMGSKVEAVPYWKKQAEELEPQVKRERQRILSASKEVGGVNLSSAFVTFASRTHAELALRLDSEINSNKEEWNLLTAPDSSDILWADLTQDDTARGARTFVGYLLVIALYFVYLPIVIGVTNLGKVVELKWFGLGSLQSVWDGVAPTLGLQFMVAFLPTFLINIFKAFFTCRAENIQQHKLQIWYYWFQIVFVVLATAVGQNFREFAMTLVTEPTAIITVLANTMPYATHYYMNFLVLQAMSHAMNLTRYIPWFKYRAALAIFDEKQAKVLAEPEDQDYYGMGSRSARWTIMLGIGLVYGTLSPPINILCFLNFFICRLAYGFLFMFAETHKPDTGGYFFVTACLQTFPLLIIYVILMAAVFYQRAASVGPCIIAALSLLWLAASHSKFQGYTWERMPMKEVQGSEVDKGLKRRPDKGPYKQPEMLQK